MNESSKKGPLINFEELTSNNIENDLKKLDSFLTCSICLQYFETCMVTECSHNFCSQCVHQNRTVCPICDVPLRDSQLRPNEIVDSFVSILPSLKNNVIRYIRTLKTLKPNTLYISPLESKSESKHDVKKRRTVKRKKERIAVFVDLETSDSPQHFDENTQRVTIPAMFFSQVNKNPPSTRPVPSTNVPKIKVKRLTDSGKCLESKEHSMKKVKNADETRRRTQLPILVTHLMTLKALKAKAREYGLNPRGKRETLKKRIEKYTFLYNVNCKKAGMLHPNIEIIQKIEKEEKRENQKRRRRIIAELDTSSSDEEEEKRTSQGFPDTYCEPSTSTTIPTTNEYSGCNPTIDGELKLKFEVGSEEDIKRNFEWKDHDQFDGIKVEDYLAVNRNEPVSVSLANEYTQVKIKLEVETEMNERQVSRYPRRSSRN